MARLLLARTTAALLLGLWAATPAAAQVFTWNDPTTGNWSAGTNWVGGTVAPSDPTPQLIFNAAGANSYTATNDIANPFLLNRLTLNNTGTGFANVGSPLTLGADTRFTGPGTGTERHRALPHRVGPGAGGRARASGSGRAGGGRLAPPVAARILMPD